MSLPGPGVSWAGRQVPIGLSPGLLAVMVGLLGAAIAEFQKTGLYRIFRNGRDVRFPLRFARTGFIAHSCLGVTVTLDTR